MDFLYVHVVVDCVCRQESIGYQRVIPVPRVVINHLVAFQTCLHTHLVLSISFLNLFLV